MALQASATLYVAARGLWLHRGQPVARMGLGSSDPELGQPTLAQLQLLTRFAQPRSLLGVLAELDPEQADAQRGFLEQLIRQGALVPVPSASDRSYAPDARGALSGETVAVCCADELLAEALRGALSNAGARLCDVAEPASWVLGDEPLKLAAAQRGLFVRITENTLQVGPSFTGEYVPEWIALTPRWERSRPCLALLAAQLVASELATLLSGLDTHIGLGALLFDLATLEFHFLRNPPAPPSKQEEDPFSEIAALYRRERRTHSLNALVVDPYLEAVARRLPPSRVLDVGAGSGEASALFARHGHHVVALEPSAAMAAGLSELAREPSAGSVSVVRGTAEEGPLGEGFDLVLLNLVLDHIQDCAHVLRRCYGALREGGQVIVVLPHPFKDSGGWQERYIDGQQRYLSLNVRDYFREGPIRKARYSQDGSLAIAEVHSFKRNLPFYFSALSSAGFLVTRMLEPEPSRDAAPSAHVSKASQVPYFLVFECLKGERPQCP